jgi:hypothetical protein
MPNQLTFTLINFKKRIKVEIESESSIKLSQKSASKLKEKSIRKNCLNNLDWQSKTKLKKLTESKTKTKNMKNKKVYLQFT